jgi:hypothetical protein
MWAARLSVCCRAGLEAADGDDLIPWPDSNGEGAGATAQNSKGAIVERLERWDHATTVDPDKGGGEELCLQLAGKLGARNPRKGKAFGHAAANISERGRASIHLDVRSMIVKI